MKWKRLQFPRFVSIWLTSPILKTPPSFLKETCNIKQSGPEHKYLDIPDISDRKIFSSKVWTANVKSSSMHVPGRGVSAKLTRMCISCSHSNHLQRLLQHCNPIASMQHHTTPYDATRRLTILYHTNLVTKPYSHPTTPPSSDNKQQQKTTNNRPYNLASRPTLPASQDKPVRLTISWFLDLLLSVLATKRTTNTGHRQCSPEFTNIAI